MVNVAVMPVYLRDTTFYNCQQGSSSYGLIDAYSEGAVALDFVSFVDSSATANLVNWGGSGPSSEGVFYSDSSMPVAGIGAQAGDQTLPLESGTLEWLAETDSHLNQIKLVRTLPSSVEFRVHPSLGPDT